MANITIRDLPDPIKESLRVHAAESGLSLEAYVRHILQAASQTKEFQPVNIAELSSRYFGKKGGVELQLPKRNSTRPIAKIER